MNTPINSNGSSKRNQGFTIVELMVVVVVIAILASVGFVGWGSWRQNAAKREVQSDLQIAAAAMKSAKNESSSNGYPFELPSTFKSSSNVTVYYRGTYSSVSKFCLEAYSNDITTIRYRFDSEVDSAPVPQTCSWSASSPAAPSQGTLTTSTSKRKISGADYITLKSEAKGAICAAGTLSWKITIQSSSTVDWNVASWNTSLSVTWFDDIPANSANPTRYVYAKARCTVGGVSTEGGVLSTVYAGS